MTSLAFLIAIGLMTIGIRRKNGRSTGGTIATLRSSDDTTAPDYFKYTMRGKEIWITYLGANSIDKDIMRILRQIEYWHQGSITSFRILYQNVRGLAARSSGMGRRRKLSRRDYQRIGIWFRTFPETVPNFWTATLSLPGALPIFSKYPNSQS
jgi:hypothetical protein